MFCMQCMCCMRCMSCIRRMCCMRCICCVRCMSCMRFVCCMRRLLPSCSTARAQTPGSTSERTASPKRRSSTASPSPTATTLRTAGASVRLSTTTGARCHPFEAKCLLRIYPAPTFSATRFEIAVTRTSIGFRSDRPTERPTDRILFSLMIQLIFQTPAAPTAYHPPPSTSACTRYDNISKGTA